VVKIDLGKSHDSKPGFDATLNKEAVCIRKLRVQLLLNPRQHFSDVCLQFGARLVQLGLRHNAQTFCQSLNSNGRQELVNTLRLHCCDTD